MSEQPRRSASRSSSTACSTCNASVISSRRCQPQFRATATETKASASLELLESLYRETVAGGDLEAIVKREVQIKINEVERPDLEAQLKDAEDRGRAGDEEMQGGGQ